MTTEMKMLKPIKGAPPAGQDVRVYIEEQLDTLARLASERGQGRLAIALQMAALEAARATDVA